MTTPTVHLNGSGRQALLDGFERAYAAIGEAMTAVRETHPNARDYYVQGPDAFPAAVREFQSRMDRLKAVREELLALFQAVDDNSGFQACRDGHFICE